MRVPTAAEFWPRFAVSLILWSTLAAVGVAGWAIGSRSADATNTTPDVPPAVAGFGTSPPPEVAPGPRRPVAPHPTPGVRTPAPARSAPTPARVPDISRAPQPTPTTAPTATPGPVTTGQPPAPTYSPEPPAPTVAPTPPAEQSQPATTGTDPPAPQPSTQARD